MKNKNEVAKLKDNTTLLFTPLDQDMQDMMSNDSAEYKDNTSTDDIAIPRIRILQSASDQTKKSTPEYIKGAEEGDLFNTLSQEIVKGDDGIYFVPVYRRIIYLEWKSVEIGGGLVNNYGEDSSAYVSANSDDKGRRISKAGNEIVKTYDIFGYVVDIEKSVYSEVLISMSKTQVKKIKQWNAMIRSLTDIKTGNQLPSFAGVYKIKTTPESNDMGSWFNYDINFAGYTIAIPKIGSSIYKKAKSFAELVKVNAIKVDHSENTSQEDSDKM